MSWQPDDFDDLAEELRRRMGNEFREEAEEVERLTNLQRRRKASLSEVALAAMHRGDQVTIHARTGDWTGELLAVGDDYVSLQAPNGTIEALLDGVAFQVVPSRTGGRSGKAAAATWKARLSEFALSGETVTVVAPDLGLEVIGAIELIARDHAVIINETGRTYIPLLSLAIVLRSATP
jgi:hypothetical protein